MKRGGQTTSATHPLEADLKRAQGSADLAAASRPPLRSEQKTQRVEFESPNGVDSPRRDSGTEADDFLRSNSKDCLLGDDDCSPLKDAQFPHLRALLGISDDPNLESAHPNG